MTVPRNLFNLRQAASTMRFASPASPSLPEEETLAFAATIHFGSDSAGESFAWWLLLTGLVVFIHL